LDKFLIHHLNKLAYLGYMKQLFKFSAYVPVELYLEFTRKAREKQMNERGTTRGAITRGIVDAINLYLGEINE